MRVLVLGSGGREHALAWAIARSPLVDEVICAPGNGGIAGDFRVLPLDLSDHVAVLELVKREGVQLVVIGPEDPLVAGLADSLGEAGVAVFGPSAEAAQLEGSKRFAKEFMERHGIPTAAHRAFCDAASAESYVRELAGPCVVKADGLAAGKGVAVCAKTAEALSAIREMMQERRFGDSGDSVVIEERLVGDEVSYYAICDGERFVCLAAAQDHKRALDGDLGENTGGMGAYSPTPVVDAELEREIVEQVVRPTVDGMRSEGRPFRGVLYVGLMISDGKPYVIEFNVRFGDPETQVLMFRMESDLMPLLLGAAEGRLPEGEVGLDFGPPAVCVAMASEGYPRSYEKGREITGLAEVAELPDVKVFHAGTRREGNRIETAGGRVLGVTARAVTIADATSRAYDAVERIHFDGAQFRSDIAKRALAETAS
ncbi:MAG: phosphoribosylamine--glycine ligase [bacterium]|nr:phosphoribosylamine--glycine ligase [bacterium]